MSTIAEKELILNSEQVHQKIRRIAFEIYENNFKEKTIILAGIDGQGYAFAKLLAHEVEAVSPLTTNVLR